MNIQNYIDKINSFLSKKTYHYEDEVYSFDYTIELNGDVKRMISIGEWTDFYMLNYKIFNLNDTSKRILSFIFKKNPEYQIDNEDVIDIKKPLRQLGIERHLGSSIKSILRTLNIKNTMTDKVLLNLSELKGDYDEITINEESSQKRNVINENMIKRETVRNVIKDIIKVVKNENEGEFNLPEFTNDEPEYQIRNTSQSFSVELSVKYDKSIDGYHIPNAFYSSEDDVIEIILIINPNNIAKNLFQLIGELNEIVTHELTHLNQYYKGQLDYDDEDLGSLEYYTREHEIPAQYYGHKRLSKLINQPFDVTVRNWFDTHKDIHQLTPDEQEIVIDKILNFKSN